MVIFKTGLALEDIQYFTSNVSDVIILPKAGSNPLGVVTSDGRPCMCNPSSAPIPGQVGTIPSPCKEGSGSDTNANYVDTASTETDTENINETLPDDLKPVESESDQATCMMLAEAV